MILFHFLICYFRLVTKEGLDNLLKIRGDLEQNRSEKSGSQNSDFYSSKDFRNAYNLMAHEDSISDDLWLLRGIVAVFLLKCLQQTDFFKNVPKGNFVKSVLHNWKFSKQLQSTLQTICYSL